MQRIWQNSNFQTGLNFMGQLTFAEAEYELIKRKTRREKFLERMDSLPPWKSLQRQQPKEYSTSWVGHKP
jgi:IS5 family transposase